MPVNGFTKNSGVVACGYAYNIGVQAYEGANFGFSSTGYHAFMLVNTDGLQNIDRWLVGQHTQAGSGSTIVNVGIKWFVRVN